MIEMIVEMFHQQRKNEEAIAKALGLKVSFVHEVLEREHWDEIDERHYRGVELDELNDVVETFGEGPWSF